METIEYKALKKAEMKLRERLNDFCIAQNMKGDVSIYFDTKHAENENGDYWIEVSESEINWCAMGSQTAEFTKRFTACLNYAIKLATAYNKKYAGMKVIYNK